MSSSTILGAAVQDRKARLAQLRSLKRKQPESADDDPEDNARHKISNDVESNFRDSLSDAQMSSITETYLSGRNYDFEAKGARLGFENNPAAGVVTLELQAQGIADLTKLAAEEEEKTDKPVDFFKLQPKKPNWDLKRDLERKLDILNVRTDNAIARLVRERIAKNKAAANAKGKGVDGEALGMEGAELVEALHQREREEEEDERMAKEVDEAF